MTGSPLAGRMEGRDSLGVWDGQVHTALFQMGNQQGPTIQHRQLCSGSCGSLDGREFDGERTQVYVRLSSLAVHLELTTLLIGYTPTY